LHILDWTRKKEVKKVVVMRVDFAFFIFTRDLAKAPLQITIIKVKQATKKKERKKKKMK
jgi:hypothetical protein